MTVSIFDENAPHDKLEFFPFDDSRASNVKREDLSNQLPAEGPFTYDDPRLTYDEDCFLYEGSYDQDCFVRLPSRGMDTREIDHLRQGVEITNQSLRFKGLVKIWAGNTEGTVRIITYGQSVPFTEFENDKAWEEHDRFDPVSYLSLGSAYPLPIILNDGPQQGIEAVLQPFTLPFLVANNEVRENARAVRGSVEDGNQDQRRLNGSTSQIKQFINFNDPNDFVPFIDGGQHYYGESSDVAERIVVPGFLNEGEATLAPFDDLGDQKIANSISSTNQELLSLMHVSLSFNLDDDIRTMNDVRSATAGWDSYGSNCSIYGTDSIAFTGNFRGC